jgi:hypothetical protein
LAVKFVTDKNSVITNRPSNVFLSADSNAGSQLKYVAGEQCIKIHDRLNEITAGTQFGFQP